MGRALESLPGVGCVSPSSVAFLNHNIGSPEQLAQAPSLLSLLQSRCTQLDQTLVDLSRRFHSNLISYSSFSHQIAPLFTDILSKLSHLPSDGGGVRLEQALGEELSALAKEVARVETVRIYAGLWFYGTFGNYKL